MTLAERMIRKALAAEFADIQVLSGARSTLEIPAANEQVGPLYIQIDPEEITVFVGPTHCHFERFEEDPEQRHIELALEFIRGVLSDKIVLWSCLGAAGTHSVDRVPRFKLPWFQRRYLWSGPIAN